MNDEAQYWINKDGENVGPFKLSEVRKKFDQGHFTESDPACELEGEEWMTVEKILGLDQRISEKEENFENSQQIILAGGSQMSLNSALTAILFFLLLVGGGLYLFVQIRLDQTNISAESLNDNDLAFEGIEKLVNEAMDFALFEEKEGLFVDRKNGVPYDGWTRYYYSKDQLLAGLIKFENGKAIFAHTWLPNGEKSPETSLQLGSGLVADFFENGSRRVKSLYRGGVLNGPRTKYHNNGEKSVVEPMVNGQFHGQLVAWAENGQKVEEIFYLKGLKSGPYSIWSEDGQKIGEGSFQNGKLDGRVINWSSDGSERTEVYYENGELVPDKNSVDEPMQDAGDGVPMNDLILSGLLEMAGEDEVWIKKARVCSEAVNYVMERFEKSKISGGEIFSDLAAGLFQYAKGNNLDSEKLESALGWIRNQWGISILLIEDKFLLSELPNSVTLGPITWEIVDYSGDFLGSLKGESRDFVVSDIQNLFASVGIELGSEEETVKRKVERQIWEELSLHAEDAKNANLELKNGVLGFVGSEEKKVKKIDPNGNSVFEVLEEVVSYSFNQRIQGKKMGPFLDVLDRARVQFGEERKGNLTIRKYEGLTIFSDLSLLEGERVIYPNVTVQLAGVGVFSENALIRAVKVELGIPVNEPSLDIE